MRELYYENQGTNTYLIYEIKEDDVIDNMSLGMLTQNTIQGIAQTVFMQMDSRRFIKFNVSAKVSMQQFFQGMVSKKHLLGAFKGIASALISAEDYMLDSASILLNPQYIFTDVTTCETELICLPVLSGEQTETDLQDFFRSIMFKTKFDSNENCAHVAEIINYLNKGSGFSLTEFKALIDTLEGAQEKTYPQIKGREKKDVLPAQPEVPPVESHQAQTMANEPGWPSGPMGNMPEWQNQPIKRSGAHQTPLQQPGDQRNIYSNRNTGAQNINNSQNNGYGSIQYGATPQPDKQISFFYLMQHYNKENAAMYKSQKELRKRQAAEQKSRAKEQNQKKKKKQNVKGANEFDFVIPGQENNMGNRVFSGQQNQSWPIQQQSTGQKYANQPVEQRSSGQQNQGGPLQKQSDSGLGYPLPYIPREGIDGRPLNFGDTTELSIATQRAGLTMPLHMYNGQLEKPAAAPYLVRVKTGEKIFINKPFFKIGSDSEYANYCIADNPAISAAHAVFWIEGEKYFIADTNSTNHTYINKNMLLSNEKVEIKHGEQIRMADEDFDFRVY